jgi:hypothetical protein
MLYGNATKFMLQLQTASAGTHEPSAVYALAVRVALPRLMPALAAALAGRIAIAVKPFA